MMNVSLLQPDAVRIGLYVGLPLEVPHAQLRAPDAAELRTRARMAAVVYDVKCQLSAGAFDGRH